MTLRIAVLMTIAAASLSGCFLWPKTQTVVRTQTVEVPKYIREPLPDNLVRPCVYAEPEPACVRKGQPEFCNEQLLAMRLGYKYALKDCNDDKTGLRALDPTHE